MSTRTYTKKDLEQLVYFQLENLNAMKGLMKAEISDFKERHINILLEKIGVISKI